MKDQFVTYEIARRLKELGFDEYCFSYHKRDQTLGFKMNFNVKNSWLSSEKPIGEDRTYGQIFESECAAPLWQQAIGWLRERGVQIYERTFLAHEDYTKIDPTFLVKQVGRFTETEPLSAEVAILKALELISKP